MTTIPFETTLPVPTTPQSQVQKIWLANCRSLNQSYGANHSVLGANSMAGYHTRVQFPQQPATPPYVDGYSTIVYSAGSLNIQTGEGGLQTITPSGYTASSYFSMLNLPPKTDTILIRTYTYPILGTPLQVFNIVLYTPKSLSNRPYIGMLQIPYSVSRTAVLSFKSLISASSSAPKSTIATPTPLWAMAQYNAALTIGSSVSTSQLGAYRNCIVIYIHGRDMAKLYPDRGWSTSIVGVI